MAHTNLINGINLTPTNSLVHLLDSNDTDDNNEVPIVKHSAYYGENDFSSMLANKAGLTILSGNIQSMKAKFDELEAFINRVNTSNPISLICLQECWLDEKNIESIAMINLKDYNMSYQTKQCCGHGGLIIYVHTQFTCTPIDTISQAATGWEYMCVELSHQTPRSPKYLVCNVYRKPGELREDFNLFLQEFASFTLNRVSTPKVHQNSRSFPGFLKVDLKFSRCKNYSYIEHCRSNIIQIRVLFVLML